MSGAISIWPQLPGFSSATVAQPTPAAPEPMAPALAGNARAKMADALYNDLYAKSISREDFDKRTAKMSDTQIADAAYKSFYEGKIDRAEFNAKVGLNSQGGAADAMMRGGMLGFSDELAAAAMTALRTAGTAATGQMPTFSGMGDAYNQELQAERDKRTVYKQNNPVAGTAMEIAGGLLSGGAGIGTQAAAIPTRMGMMRDAARIGAVAGFGEGEGSAANRVESMGIGAGVGAGIGAAVPLVTQGASMLLGRVGKMFGLGDTEKTASQLLLKAFQDDGIPPAEIATRLAEWQKAGGKPAALFDLGGENVRRLARTAAGRTGPGTEKAVTFLEGRQADQARRIAGDVEANLGQSASDFYPTLQALDTTRRVAASPKYEAAFNRIIPTADEVGRVERFLTSKNGQEALQRGLRVIEEEQVLTGVPFSPKAFGVVQNADGRFTLEPGKVPNLRLMDAVKRGYDRILDDFRDKATGRLDLNDYTRAVEGNRAAYVKELRDMYQRYGAALDAWAGPSAAIESANKGRNIFNMKDADIATTAMNLRRTPADAESFRLGVAQAMRDKIANAPDGADAVKRIFGSPTKRELLKAAFPNERAFLAFEAQMKRETDLYKNAQFVSPRTGSQTAPREADAGDFGAMASDMAGALMTGVLVPGQTVRGAIGQQFRNMGARAQGVTSGVADVLASRMFTSDPRAIAQTGGLLSQADINNALAALQARRLGGALLPGLSAGVNVAR